MKKLKIELPDHERGLSAGTVARIDRLQARAENKALPVETRREARKELDRLERSRAAADEQAWLSQSQAETVSLAERRGEEIEHRNSGSVRMKTRDGLQSALEAKDGLSGEQYDAGKAFREAWELRSGDIGSQLGSEGGGDHQNDRFVYARLTRAKKLQLLGRVERAIAVECSAEPATLQMIREVAGNGKCLSAFGKGRAYGRNLASLKLALDIAGDLGMGPAKKAEP